MPRLIVHSSAYDPDRLAAWTARQRHAIAFPAESIDFARCLKRKVRGRSSRSPRFFGEAFVASQISHRKAYYCSFKWLTNRRFANDRALADDYQEEFRRALHEHFTRRRIERLQDVALGLAHRCRKALKDRLPTAPDLWLIDRKGQHRFIEVKLPGDSLAPHQVAGMAVIASVLNGPQEVSLEVVQLSDDDRLFKEFCRAIRAG